MRKTWWLLSSLAVALVGLGYLAVGDTVHDTRGRYLEVPKDAFTAGAPVMTLPLKDYALRNEDTDGIHVVRLPDGSFLALSWNDTHRKDCKALYEPLRDPSWVLPDGIQPTFRTHCNGSIYDLQGRPISGPAPRSLDRFGVETVGNVVRVDLADRHPGSKPVPVRPIRNKDNHPSAPSKIPGGPSPNT